MTRAGQKIALGVLGVLLIPAGRLFADDGADAKKAVETFLTAVHDGDDKTARGLVSASPEDNAAVTAYLDLMLATIHLQKAAVAKFGATASDTFGEKPAAFDARMKAVHEATAKMTGTAVIVSIPDDASAKVKGLTLVLTKTPAGWKIDGGSLFDISPDKKAETDKHVAIAKKLLAITTQMIQEINDGKYAAAVDAYQEFWARAKPAKAKEPEPPATTQAK